MADSTAKVEVVKIATDSLLKDFEAVRSGDGKNTVLTFPNGATVLETPFRLYFSNPADGVAAEVGEKFSVRKDGAIGIKFVKATPLDKVKALFDLASKSDIYVKPVEADKPKADGDSDENAEATD